MVRNTTIKDVATDSIEAGLRLIDLAIESVPLHTETIQFAEKIVDGTKAIHTGLALLRSEQTKDEPGEFNAEQN